MVGKRIKELRKRRNMSLRRLAETIPLSVSFLSDIENGRSNPSIKRLEEIALALNTTTAYLIDGDPVTVRDFPESIQTDAVFKEVIDRLRDFDIWPLPDREELLVYLRAKEIVRNRKKA